MAKHANKRAEYIPDSHGLLAEVSELYYKDGLTQKEIALRFGVSRPTIVNYIRQAREQGIVDIKINGSSYTGSSLSRDLCERYGLKDVYIARADQLDISAPAERIVARLAATALSDLLCPGDVVGVPWGGTIQQAAAEMPSRHVDNLSVCQLVGSMYSLSFSAAESCAIRIANRTGGVCSTLHTPAILSSVSLADELRKEPIVQHQLSKFNDLTKVFFSVGDVQESTLVVTCGIATEDELKSFKQQGAKAVLCGHFLNQDGEQIKSNYSDRIIGISPAKLREVPVRLFVAQGADKIDAVKATLAGNYATHLIVDSELAELL